MEQLFFRIEETLEVIKLCFDQNPRPDLEIVGDEKMQPIIQNIEMLYSAATILLDLSANEQYIDRISASMRRLGMFDYVINDKLLHLTDSRIALKTS
jgi:hypothetical protein